MRCVVYFSFIGKSCFSWFDMECTASFSSLWIRPRFLEEIPQHIFFFFSLLLLKKRSIESNGFLPIGYIVSVLWLRQSFIHYAFTVSFIHLIFWLVSPNFPSNRIIHLFPFDFSQSQIKSCCATVERISPPKGQMNNPLSLNCLCEFTILFHHARLSAVEWKNEFDAAGLLKVRSRQRWTAAKFIWPKMMCYAHRLCGHLLCISI